ncbi:LytR/AlgR family response regulator transcription factor [Desulfovibrio ferrophilus]|uniref:Two component transcriptional regulator, LytTR family n=1 Tax=Desulfovibrio ferrophilus TaxID=241368 RepID=A0A2Z6B140_9BACT|nr:LytTR family DNA-binding domain-containing protein [Desulfovibrio ferrophilus]BBD09175.1 two component transcriptional regulator, LytTR family [Desulfovibrio ferrophilus]
MRHLNTLLLHPDSEVRATLRGYLEDVEFLRVLGEAVTGFEALELLEHVPYGVFFVGMELAEGVSGLELAQMLAGRKHKPALVFIANDESQAFSAFELGATDYLLWPTTPERFKQTLQRLRQFQAHYKEIPPPSWTEDEDETADEHTLQLPLGEEEEDRFLKALSQAWEFSNISRPVEIEKLPINMDGRTILIPYTQIIFVEAYEDYSYVHTASQKYLTSYRLKTLEERLRQYRFFRVHRKFLVNLEMVTEIASLPGSNFMLRTQGKTRIELPISRRRITELKKILGL